MLPGPSAFGLGFYLVAHPAKRLQVVIVIRAAFKLWHLVIDDRTELSARTLIDDAAPQALLAQAAVALQDAWPDLVPLTTISTLVS